MSYTIQVTRQAEKDIAQLTPKLKAKLKNILLNVICKEPYCGKKLLRELAGSFSYRLTYKDRIVYSVDQKNKIVYLERAKTHYGE